MGIQEDNEREIGKMTLERLAMRRQIAEEAVRTAEHRVQMAKRLAELKEQEAQIRGVAQDTVSPPYLPPAPASKADASDIMVTIVFKTLMTAFGAFSAGTVTYLLSSRNPVYGWWAAVIGGLVAFGGSFCEEK